jgi:DNA-binding CsgD family transcriptional regulator/tetratricopeptide (TPR) repeat protein
MPAQSGLMSSCAHQCGSRADAPGMINQPSFRGGRVAESARIGLVGRADECLRIEELIDDARSGRSATLVLVGEPGIGKTALISYAREHATGTRVIATSGHEATQGMPFGHLADLEAPLHAFMTTLSEQHRRVLEVALGRETSAAPPDVADRYAVGVALLELLVAAAASEPLVVLIDDAHWVDASTAGALAFAVRRLVADPIAIMFAIRAGEDTPMLHSAPSPQVVGGLKQWEAVELLGPDVDAGVAAELARTTNGNPLAMLNAAASLSDEQRRGRRGLTAPIAVGPYLEKAFAVRAAELAEPARLFMILLAAEGPAELSLLSAAASELGIEAAAALEMGTSAGLVVVVDSRVEFQHPLVRSAVYHQAGLDDRRSAHAALANVLRRGDDLDRRAFHLAAATSCPDEATASVVEAAANAASERRAYAEAGTGYTLAASLSPVPEDALRRTVYAANAHHRAGETRHALGIIERALETTGDPLVRADLLIRRMEFAVQTDRSIGDLSEVLTEAADQVVDLDPSRAVILLMTAAMPAMATGRGDLMEGAATRALELATGTPLADVTQVLRSLTRLYRGNEFEAHSPLGQFSLAAADSDVVPETSMLVPTVAIVLAWADRIQLALSLLDKLVSVFRATSMLANLGQVLTNRAWVHFYAGEWPTGLADGAEALALAEEMGQSTIADYTRLILASIEAAQGRAEARERVERALAAFESRNAPGLESWAHGVLGFLEQGAGRPDQAVLHFERTEGLLSDGGPLHPMITSSATELVEAYIRLGDRAAAEGWLATATERALKSGCATALAQATRCRGLLVAPADRDVAFEEALDWHTRSPRPFERARTELCYGERLRRDRRPGQAVPHLEVAQDIFSVLGATPWLRRCNAELQACGVTTGETVNIWLRSLTPQEIQVALVVAGGATNRDAATALFLSPRTVEFHLASVYRKLRVRSRSQLARKMAEAGKDWGAHDSVVEDLGSSGRPDDQQ